MSTYICNMFLCLTFSNRIILQCIFFITCFIHVIYIILELSLCQSVHVIDGTQVAPNESCYCIHILVPLTDSGLGHVICWSVGPQQTLYEWRFHKHLHMRAYLLARFLFESRCQVTRGPKQLCGKVYMEKRGFQPIAPAEPSAELLNQGSAN